MKLVRLYRRNAFRVSHGAGSTGDLHVDRQTRHRQEASSSRLRLKPSPLGVATKKVRRVDAS